MYVEMSFFFFTYRFIKIQKQRLFQFLRCTRVKKMIEGFFYLQMFYIFKGKTHTQNTIKTRQVKHNELRF